MRDKVIAVAIAVVSSIFMMIILIIDINSNKHDNNVMIDWNSPQFIGERSGYYSTIFRKYDIDKALPEEVQEEFIEDDIDNSELISLYGISFKDGTLSSLAIQCNTTLFELCNKYYLTSYNGLQLSPLIPMAVANVETPDRVDTDITYTSLFPSKCFDIKTSDAISNMSCLAVVESPKAFNMLASDYCTDNRGALQMSSDCGVGLEAFNSLMGSSEESIVANVVGAGIDFTDYVAYESSTLTMLSAQDWLDSVSTSQGDRFNVRDSVLRFASKSQEIVDRYATMYDVSSDIELVLAIATGYNCEHVWDSEFITKGVGDWRSGNVAYSFVKALSTDNVIFILKDLVDTRLDDSRNSGRRIPISLERSEVYEFYNTLVEKGFIEPMTTYTTAKSDVCCYPIQVLYSYYMLAALFSGK